jgi:FkbH-like protein
MKLDFLPICEDWSESLAATRTLLGPEAIRALVALAGAQLSFPQIGKLDRALTRLLEDQSVGGVQPGTRGALPGVRLAILGSATLSHLAPGIRVAALRRRLLVEIYEGNYGMYLQELVDTGSELHRFRPDVLLIALDAHHLAEAPESTAEHALATIEQCWTLARQHLNCAVVQQTVLPIFAPMLGNNEQRLPGSPAAIVEQINAGLRPRADQAGVHLLALDSFSRSQGIAAWHEPALWYRSKHEVHPRAALLYGDQVARILAALRGSSSKCLVLDLDNTLWGGVIGDDGLEGIALGQGSAVGEAFLAFQRWCRSLTSRGIILAVCSKNDEANARLPFQKHPEMVLRESDIACFVANWQDKSSNLRQIAATLNIGIDALVFADDNPAERALIRRELPEVQVPELPLDPAGYIDTIAAAGYFEGLRVTAEDQERSRQYQANAERARMRSEVTDMEGYLASLAMHCIVRPFDEMGVPRITQLINKTNQFNLTTRRYTEEQVRETMLSPDAITLQVRLTDRFGDNGIIAILIARATGPGAAEIDTWLMSCRVLGRRVEEASLNTLAAACRRRGIHRLVGIYRPTAKNNMVQDLYPRLGFTVLAGQSTDQEQRFTLDLEACKPHPVPMEVEDTLSPQPQETHATA